MGNKMLEYLQDPFLKRLYTYIKKAGPIRSISLDITHTCNIRCLGCYYFNDNMDASKAPLTESDFDAFIQREKERGTNYITVVGGEPSLVLDKLKKLHDNFRIFPVTNGTNKIPVEGFEDMPIAVSVWGDHDTDTRLRGGGKIDVFARGLKNYRDDPRARWHYTTTPGNAREIESVVTQCVENGNYVFFNFYSDLSNIGAAMENKDGFASVRREIEKMIARYPDRILLTSYVCEVVSTGILQGEE